MSENFGDLHPSGLTLSVDDKARYATHVEVAALFGRTYKGHQRATFRLDEHTEVWFPKLISNELWVNELFDDGAVLTMRPKPGGTAGEFMAGEPLRERLITFVQVSPHGPSRYAFQGVYEVDRDLSDSTRWLHRRVATTVHIGPDFSVSFKSDLVTLDDQAAEAAPSDPEQVAAFEQQIEAENYQVKDQVVMTRVRGSAQAAFARRVKDNYGWKCAVTGIRTQDFLVASHIVPWSEDESIRLDPSNGICLSTFVDRAFDTGFLSITAEGRTAVNWDRVTDDPNLQALLAEIDGVELTVPSTGAPDRKKLERRIALDS